MLDPPSDTILGELKSRERSQQHTSCHPLCYSRQHSARPSTGTDAVGAVAGSRHRSARGVMPAGCSKEEVEMCLQLTRNHGEVAAPACSLFG